MNKLNELLRLRKALAKSDPWDKDGDIWTCIHCGGVYDWNSKVIQKPHEPDCVWNNAQESEEQTKDDEFNGEGVA